MADFTEMIISGAQKSVSQAGEGSAEAYQKGAQLALAAEELQQKKASALNTKAEIRNTQITKFQDYLFKAQEAKDPKAKAGYLKMAPRVRDAYGIEPEVFSDEAIAALGSDEDSGRAYTLAVAVKDPNSPLFGKPEEAMRIFNNPEQRIKVTPTPEAMRVGEEANISKSASEYLDYQAKQLALKQQEENFTEGQTATTGRDKLDRREKASKEIADKLVLEFQADINTLDSGIPGGIKGWKKGDIAGISGSQGKLPGSELSGTAAQNRLALQRLVNAQLKEFSGASLTDNELKNQLEGLGISTQYLNGSWVANVMTGLKSAPSPGKVIQGIRYLERRQANKVRRIKNTYGPDVYDEVVSGADVSSLSTTTKKEGEAPPPPAPEKVAMAIESVKKNIPNYASAPAEKIAALKQSLAKRLSTAELTEVLNKLGIK